jgi:hypothetical protein
VEIQVGTGTEIRSHILALPPTATGRLEDILLRGENDRRQALRELASGIGPYQLAEGRAGELLGLPWTEVAPALADLKLSDPLPLLEAIGGCPPNPGLARFCVAVGLDRWPSLRRVDVPATLLPGLWEAWPPLGAFIDAGGARVDPGSAERCQDGLGWAPGELMICDGCRDPMEAEGPCAACGSSSVVFEARPLPDGGAVEGLAFRPQPALVRAMRAVLLPVPSLPFGPDGWVAASLESLDSLLTVPDSGALESERDAQVEAYRQHLVPHEARIAQGVRAHALKQRDSHPQQYTWAYVCRMSLTTAFARRLMARSRLSLPADATAALDELAAWLEARFARIYERDLCFAELVCCKEYEWT